MLLMLKRFARLYPLKIKVLCHKVELIISVRGWWISMSSFLMSHKFHYTCNVVVHPKLHRLCLCFVLVLYRALIQTNLSRSFTVTCIIVTMLKVNPKCYGLVKELEKPKESPAKPSVEHILWYIVNPRYTLIWPECNRAPFHAPFHLLCIGRRIIYQLLMIYQSRKALVQNRFRFVSVIHVYTNQMPILWMVYDQVWRNFVALESSLIIVCTDNIHWHCFSGLDAHEYRKTSTLPRSTYGYVWLLQTNGCI